MKHINVLEDVLIIGGISVSVTMIQSILGIIILSFQIILILFKAGKKIYDLIKAKKYDEIENQKLSSEEGRKFMESTKKMVEKINNAFKKQLSSLYQSDIIDTDAEMKVFDSMLKADGYNDDDFNV